MAIGHGLAYGDYGRFHHGFFRALIGMISAMSQKEIQDGQVF